MNIEKFTRVIQCHHTPETIDRIIMPIRKRAMMVTSFQYACTTATEAKCTLTFESNELEAEKIYKNMLRIIDIISINR